MEELKKVEDAAKNYASVTDPEAHGIEFMCEVFVAGAEWDREQMMAEAVDTVVSLDAGGFPFIEFGVGKFGLKVGDKVRVIIVKED